MVSCKFLWSWTSIWAIFLGGGPWVDFNWAQTEQKHLNFFRGLVHLDC